MSQPSEDDLELYVLGGFTGDVEALEAHLAADPAARAFVAEQAQLELALREVARAATFCSGCDAVVGQERCDDCGAAVTAGGFAIERVLIQSARGRMYLARDAGKRPVALKELAFVQPPGADAVAAFEREAGFLRSLTHPGIPRFVASFRERSGVHTRLYLAQEYIQGEPLDRRMAQHWFDEREIIDIARQVLTILSYLQALSPMVVHRDIKPANLIRRNDGTIALVDFGAAYDQGQTLGSTTVGTFGYMPIEQMAGVVDATTDPYALGASLLHLLTRREPWKLLESASLGNPNVSPSLLAFLRKLTARDQGDRFAGAADALASLDRLGSAPVGEAPATRRRNRRWLLPALAIAAATTTGAVVIDHLIEDAVKNALSSEAGSVGASVAEATDPIDAGGAAAYPSDAGVADAPDPYGFERNRPTDLPPGKTVDADFKSVPVLDALLLVADAGNVSIVVPAQVRGEVTLKLNDVPWERALEAILRSHGLGYRYHPQGRTLLVAPRAELPRFLAPEAPGSPAAIRHGELPDGESLDLDFKKIELPALIQLLAGAGGVSVVIPSDVRGDISIRLKQVPWHEALVIVLESSGLDYQYRAEDRLLLVTPRVKKPVPRVRLR